MVVSRFGRLAVVFGLLVAVLFIGMASGRQRQGATVTVQLLAINDLHGNLEPPAGANGRIGNTPAGGIEYFATHLKNDIARNPNSIVVAAGDLTGASPLISALFHDEPTIASLNEIGLAVTAVGNHEFDHGWRELLRLQGGGCHPTDGCQGAPAFAGAAFQYLSANVAGGPNGTSATLFPPTAVRTVGGVKIGFIGETLRDTPGVVTPTAIEGLTFLDEATTANRYAAALEAQGVHAIVLLIHEGGTQTTGARPDGCNDFEGDLIPIVEHLSADIRVVVSGHTHQFYNCTIAGHVVTSASWYGRMITRIDLTIDLATGRIVNASAANDIVTRDVPKDPVQSRILASFGERSASIANRVVGSVTGEITRATNAAGESRLGDLIADAELEAASPPLKGGAVVAFTNPGGMRADLNVYGRTGDAAPHPVTYNDLFTIQPFGDVITVVTLTGDELRHVLEQQFDTPSARILSVSKGFEYRYRMGAPAGQRIEPRSIKINGRVIAPSDQVRVAVPDFLADNALFKQGRNRLGGDLDVDALVAFFQTHSPVSAGPRDRITRAD